MELHSHTLPMSPHDFEHSIDPFTLSPNKPEPTSPPAVFQRRMKVLTGIFLSVLLLACLMALSINQDPENQQSIDKPEPYLMAPSRGPNQGVSEKTFRDVSGDGQTFNWTNDMLTWQRTAYHFQPEKNWMNDPDGPLFYMGWYHLFYQYNPDSAIWGNITWGHAVSTDLIHWLYLPIAMVPDSWYDINGVWTGSATLLSDGQIIMLYTGDTEDYLQVQNLAYPANLSDPLLLDWVKYSDNPVMVPPTGIGKKDFRDPTTAWLADDGKWRVAIGSKVNTTGITLVYTTTNFTSFELLDGVLHEVEGTGMWECVDFYPVSTISDNGLDTSVDGLNVKHVLKASLDDEKKDFYAIGTYDVVNNTWIPDDEEIDVGIGLRYDWGKYYASKSFYDQNKQRRILWGWIGETDSEADDILKGWASVQSIPRTVVFDNKTGTNLLQWPVEEVESLRLNKTEFSGVELSPGSVVPLNITSTSQLDIIATFEIEETTLKATLEADVGYNCSTSGAAVRGALGPFGILLFADNSLAELTPVYFYISKDVEGNYKTFFCTDELRSSKASEVNKKVYGSTVTVLDDENLTMRLLVDHSIIEGFAQGGRTVITSRVYPTNAIYESARLFLFNNATGLSVKASLKIWDMDSAYISPYPFDQDEAM
ncbi:beta-fructofuranosidase, soluble isoenzyme I-like [Impatiens glandulifera]|uniref:beta-fructofuranosidase, soluble isoenzyme I-like n=1 Tax=Impatiens glandulifera TaxID=253017 RepID=UPI001FB0F981|nr:beta-fructofuranosidase, soluble isoenzyme I-like [Impatiens glandulifera]